MSFHQDLRGQWIPRHAALVSLFPSRPGHPLFKNMTLNYHYYIFYTKNNQSQIHLLQFLLEFLGHFYFAFI